MKRMFHVKRLGRVRKIPRPVFCVLGGDSGRSRSSPLPRAGLSCMLRVRSRKERDL